MHACHHHLMILGRWLPEGDWLQLDLASWRSCSASHRKRERVVANTIERPDIHVQAIAGGHPVAKWCADARDIPVCVWHGSVRSVFSNAGNGIEPRLVARSASRSGFLGRRCCGGDLLLSKTKWHLRCSCPEMLSRLRTIVSSYRVICEANCYQDETGSPTGG